MRRRHALYAASSLVAAALLSACASDLEPVPPPKVPAQDRCPEGFGPLGSGLNSGCYATLEDADWISAEDACEAFESEGIEAHLVVVDRQVEHAVLSELSFETASGLWTGRFQPHADDEFRNVNFIDYPQSYFGPGEPNDYGEDCRSLFDCDGRPGIGDERCIEYHRDTGMWNDKACYRLGAVVCEWDGVAPLRWRPQD